VKQAVFEHPTTQVERVKPGVFDPASRAIGVSDERPSPPVHPAKTGEHTAVFGRRPWGWDASLGDGVVYALGRSGAVDCVVTFGDDGNPVEFPVD